MALRDRFECWESASITTILVTSCKKREWGHTGLEVAAVARAPFIIFSICYSCVNRALHPRLATDLAISLLNLEAWRRTAGRPISRLASWLDRESCL